VALLGLNPEFTHVEEIGGKVVVNISNTVLFSPGTANFTEAGLSALSKMGQDLAAGPSARIVVIGDPNDTSLAGQEGDLETRQTYAVMQELARNGCTADMLVSNSKRATAEQPDQVFTQIVLTPGVNDLAALLQGG
jgi:outer membrane protein OmpA-like peptidoglycan-associated protein